MSSAVNGQASQPYNKTGGTAVLKIVVCKHHLIYSLVICWIEWSKKVDEVLRSGALESASMLQDPAKNKFLVDAATA